MSDLRDFVLDYYRANGALVEPPRYGVYEALLPDALAAELDVPALQEIVFDDLDSEDDGRLHLAQGHPLLERIVERARRAPAPAQVYINPLRLDKPGLFEAAGQTLSFANARLAPLPEQLEAPALSHCVVFTFKATLTTDEKHEQLVTVAMDAQAGWPVDWEAIRSQAAVEEAPAFAHLPAARPRWTDEPRPLTPSALAALLERAERAAQARLAGPVESLGRRAARNLELDRARLEQYYSDLLHDLERRSRRAEGERQATLVGKIAAAQAERGLKLADAEARYRLRVDFELITAQVVAQPKLELLVQVENRNTAVQRRIVWDPLLRTVEPLACDVCGLPGLSLQLCSGGHLAHAGCLLEEQCSDCKRVYCRLCAEQMAVCSVCARPVCKASLNRCGECGRGTCHEHTGLCHAAAGAPARPAPKAVPAPAARPQEPAPAAKPQKPAAPPKPRLAKKAPAKAPVQPNTANWRIEVEVEWSEPEVRAFVLSGRRRGPAVRTWRLTRQGIGVTCDCEKDACPADARLLQPARAFAIEAQMQDEIDKLRQEYGVPARNISYTLLIRGMPSTEPRLTLRNQWKDEAVLAEARAGFDVVYAQQHPELAPPARRPAPVEPELRPLQPHEKDEAQRFLKLAYGLLTREGTLREDELYARVHALARPGDWCTPGYAGALLRQNDRSFKVLANGLVAYYQVSNVQALAARKRQHSLPPHPWTAEELLAIAEKQPLSEREVHIQAELARLTGIDGLSVRAIQGDFQRDITPKVVVSSLERHYGVTDPDDLKQAAVLVEELYQHTPLWKLGGWTPAEAQGEA